MSSNPKTSNKPCQRDFSVPKYVFSENKMVYTSLARRELEELGSARSTAYKRRQKFTRNPKRLLQMWLYFPRAISGMISPDCGTISSTAVANSRLFCGAQYHISFPQKPFSVSPPPPTAPQGLSSQLTGLSTKLKPWISR